MHTGLFKSGLWRWLLALTVTSFIAIVWTGCGGSDSGTTTEQEGGTCTTGQSVCQSGCSNLTTDPQNCGTCGTVCGALQTCSAGKCTSVCGSGQTTCTADGGSFCASTATDNANCGACGKTCPSGQVCSQGACGNACGGTAETSCSSDGGLAYCAITGSDNANCGSCGHACTVGTVCASGMCSIAACAGANDLLCTPEGGAAYCVNKTTDSANCGACGNACGPAQVCVGGTCSSGCGGNDGGAQMYCAPDGGAPYCANTATDNSNCGACGNACGLAQICSGGSCVSGCGAVDGGGATYCANDGGAPYCANTATDNSNCGTCGKKCGAAQTCSNGACVSGCGGADGGGETYCTPDSGTPYCANVTLDNGNCGSCGNRCATQATCSNGNCITSCQTIALLSTAGASPAALITALQAAAPSALCTVDYINVNAAVPTLATLQRYDALLVYNENGVPYTDPTGVGNVVASYFDTGGRVVIALFADGGYAIAGNWTTRNYNLIAAAFVGQAADSFSSAIPAQDLVPSSPILSGVNTITAAAAAWHGTQAVANGGAPVAKWASGGVLAVAGVITDSSARRRNRVDLNIQPTDVGGGVVTGDAIKLFVNSLLYQ